MVLSRLLPRNTRFSQLFTQQAQNAVKAAEALVDLLEHYTDIERKVQVLRELEHEGDRLSRELINVLAGSFIVPFDREDIMELNTHLDDLVDDIEESGRKLMLYRIRQPVPQALHLARTVLAQDNGVTLGIDAGASTASRTPPPWSGAWRTRVTCWATMFRFTSTIRSATCAA